MEARKNLQLVYRPLPLAFPDRSSIGNRSETAPIFLFDFGPGTTGKTQSDSVSRAGDKSPETARKCCLTPGFPTDQPMASFKWQGQQFLLVLRIAHAVAGAMLVQ